MYKVVLDAGHGQYLGNGDPGAVSGNRKECDYTLAQAMTIKKMLESTGEVEVILTRQDKNNVSIADRLKIANDSYAKLFISLHMSAEEDLNKRGSCSYFSQINRAKNGLKLATNIQNNLVKIGFSNNSLCSNLYYLMENVQMTPVTINTCFISNNLDMLLYNTQETSRAIANGILKYLGVAEIVDTIFTPTLITGQSPTQIYIGEITPLVDGIDLYETNLFNKNSLSCTKAYKKDISKVMEKLNISGISMYRLRNGFYIISDPKFVKFKSLTSTPVQEKCIGDIVINYEGLAVHNKPSWSIESICLTAKKGEVVSVLKRINISNGYMYQLRSGLYITAAPEYVTFIPAR